MTEHVLIVEDDRDIRETVAEVLEAEGYVVTQAAQGVSALETLKKMSSLPDIILLDLMMPVMDGYEFRHVQQATPRLASIPIVLMSADPQVAELADELDARSYVRKPFALSDILAAFAATRGRGRMKQHA